MRTVARAIFGIFVIFVVVSLFGHYDGPKTGVIGLPLNTPAPPARETAINVTAVELYRAYNANEVAADNRYKGKLLRVTGSIADISKDMFDGIYLLMEGPALFNQTHARLGKGMEGTAARYSKGQQVTLYCTGAGAIMHSAMLNDCHD